MAGLYFTERLTIGSWIRLLAMHLVKIPRSERGVYVCYVFDSSWLALHIALASGWMTNVTVKIMDFRITDIRDDEGLSIRLRVAHSDIASVQHTISNDPLFHRYAAFADTRENNLPLYIRKSLAEYALAGQERYQYTWNALLVIQTVYWQCQKQNLQKPVLFLVSRPWFHVLVQYAESYGITLVAIGRSSLWRKEVRKWFRRIFAHYLIALLYRGRRRTICVIAPRSTVSKIAVEYYGHLNLDSPECFSDLFFLQESDIVGSDVCLLFSIGLDPLDQKKLSALEQRSITPLVLSPRATTLTDVPVFNPYPKLPWGQVARFFWRQSFGPLERRWVESRAFDYQWKRDYWMKVFGENEVKIFMQWYKYDASHMAITDALRSLGGISAIYQRAYDSYSSPELTIGADIAFGFSPIAAQIECANGSKISYQVAVGYPGDHRFPLLKTGAESIRRNLKERGATHILAFLDENTLDDSRWFIGHEFTRVNYVFLLEKLLECPWLGLVIKPKKPSDLYQRLGSVSELLESAKATGRCYIFEEGAMQGLYPPAAAALVADIAIHECLSAGTAGVECALAGVPTLLLDREGWSVSPLYKLGVGKVVFTRWQDLWEACLTHWQRPGGIPGFGDWSSMLQELDPFRDGKAAQRIGTYLKWLLDGFKAGLSRETVMADAAERYTKVWGRDKIQEKI
ncbi:MAG: hypothetical protein Q7R79_02580 [bacterium]|nr:hypothetical protein [bacterium]